MTKVSAATFQQQFGRYRAQRETVAITSHGDESVMLISAAEYHRLKQQDRQALYAWELAETELAEIARAEPPEDAAELDHELTHKEACPLRTRNPASSFECLSLA